MDHWLPALRDDLTKEFDAKPPTATLATVRRIDGTATATARTVVVRDIGTDGAMLVTSDARSEKNAEARQSPGATLLFWLASTKRQFRISGSIDVPTKDRQRVWSALSDRARALFVWPAPGHPREDVAFAETLSADAPIPASFEVLRLTPTEVETLDLNSHPHERVRWTRAGDQWQAERVNP